MVGGRGRELRVQIDPSRLKAYGLTLPLRVAGVIQGENLAPYGPFRKPKRKFSRGDRRFIRSKEDLDGVVVGVNEQRPVYLRQVAEVIDGPSETSRYVWFGEGLKGSLVPEEVPAVTVAIAKQAGTNAVTVAEGVIRKVEEMKGT